MEKQIAPLRQKIRAKEIEKEKLRNLAAEEEESLNTAIHQFSGDKKYLTDLTTQIDAYTGSNKPHDLDQIVSEVVKVADRIKDQRSALATLEPEVESVRNTVNDQERHKKQLKENVEILESEKRINELVEEIGGLDSKLENVEGRDTCIGKHEEANRRREKQLGAKARIEGRWGEIVEQIRSLKVSALAERILLFELRVLTQILFSYARTHRESS
jgi:DNA repair protein RAD50